ncbi:MAG: ADP-ribosylation factor-like protein [Candidatus Hodarchaeales archaeon]|jgi:small GTP-binding protein
MPLLDNLSKVLRKKKKNANVAWLGLDFAGKTTLIKYITEGVFNQETKRTLGLNIDEYETDGIKLICWDIGGQEVFREHLWETYIKQSSGIIYVIDSSTPERFPEARHELWRWIVENPYVSKIPLLILANKQDLPQAKDSGKIATMLDLKQIDDFSYSILPCSAATGDNILDGLEWMKERILETL